MDDQTRAGATASAEETPEPVPSIGPNTRSERRHRLNALKEYEAQLRAKAKEVSEVLALRSLAAQAQDTAQMCVRLLKAFMDKEIEVGRVDANGASALVLWVPEGKDVSDDLLTQLVGVFKMPVVTLTKGLGFEAIPVSGLEKAGWIRRLATAPSAPEGAGA